MTASRLERMAPLSGVATVIFLAVGSSIFGFFEYLPAADPLAEYAIANTGRIYAASYIGFLAAFTMLWFAGSLYEHLHQRQGDSGRLAMIAFGGGVATAVTIAAGFAAMLTFAARAGTEDGIDLIQAVTLYDFYGNILGGMTGVTLSVFIAATAAFTLREKIFPDWFGWISIIIAVGLLTPIAYFVLALALLWILYVSIRLYR